MRIVLSACVVQGEGAPDSIVRALAAPVIQKLPGLDVVILGRGGGASEDLWAFNDERVARAIAGCRVPVVSAVGHEVDVTIADLVADLRAATPSNAAELIITDLRSLVRDVEASREGSRARSRCEWERSGSRSNGPVLRVADPRHGFSRWRKRLVDADKRLVRGEQRVLRARRTRRMRSHDVYRSSTCECDSRSSASRSR